MGSTSSKSISEQKKNWHDAALQNQRETGLFILRTLILLNGGGIVLLLTLLSSASSDAAFSVSVGSVKAAAYLFLVGIGSALGTATMGYATALYSNRDTGLAEIPKIGHRAVHPTYFILGIGSMVAFMAAVVAVVCGVSST